MASAQSPRNFFPTRPSSEGLAGLEKHKILPLATGTRTERTKGMPRAGPEGESGAIASQHHRRVPLRSRAWQGRTRPVTFRERRKLDMPSRPAAFRRVRPFKSSGPTFPECSRRHPSCFRQHTLNGLRARREGAGERAGPGGLLSCVSILEREFHPVAIWKKPPYIRPKIRG
jgi:hypothetical protein